MFAAAELLVALHCPEPGPGGALALSQKAQMAAVDTALHSPDIFPQHAIAQVRLQRLGIGQRFESHLLSLEWQTGLRMS